jgi:hypothetical protein
MAESQQHTVNWPLNEPNWSMAVHLRTLTVVEAYKHSPIANTVTHRVCLIAQCAFHELTIELDHLSAYTH